MQRRNPPGHSRKSTGSKNVHVWRGITYNVRASIDIRSNRISKEIYRQSTAGFSPIPMELYQKSEALIQPILFNLEHKKHGLKVQGSHSLHKHRTAFMVLLPQYNPQDFSCSVSFAMPRNESSTERKGQQVEPYRRLHKFRYNAARCSLRPRICPLPSELHRHL